MEELLIWVGRAVKLIPVIRQLWDAIKAEDADGQFAAQMEMVRKIRGQQSVEEFLYDLSDEPTKPGGE
jgi:hypothetical protein